MFCNLRHVIKNFISVLLFLLFFSIELVFAASDSTIIGQQVTGPCNNNGVCEASLGEDSNNCLADCPLPTPTLTLSPILPAGGGGVILPIDNTVPIIQGISVEDITSVSAKVLWKTNELSVCQFFLGVTEEYEKESFSEESFFLDHSLLLDDLFSGSDYYFKIICSDTNKNKSETKSKFESLPLPDTMPPVNVSDFKATGEDAKINLSWQNPEDADFQSVKLFRSESFFPKNPEEGKLIYEGRKTSFADMPLENDKKYYYTIFAFDFSGNFSSGAAASAMPKKTIVPITSPTGTLVPSRTPGETATPATITPKITPSITTVPIPMNILSKMNELNLEDFIFSQDGVIIIPAGEKIEVDFKKPVTISVDAAKIPDEVGAMMLILSRDDETFSFLFKLNPEKTKYETVVKPLFDSAFLLTITILDKENNILKAITGQMISAEKGKKSADLFSSADYFSFLFILILLIILAIKYYSKKKKAHNA